MPDAESQFKMKESIVDKYLTDEFRNRISGAFGQSGLRWLGILQQIIDDTCDKWSIRLSAPFQPWSYNFVAPAVKTDGEQVVLKAGVPNYEFENEINALRHFDGHGAVRLIESDAKSGLMLLEHLLPGMPLQKIESDSTATLMFVSVIRRLPQKADKNNLFPSVSEWARGFKRLRSRFEGGTGPLSNSLVDRAERLMNELIDSMSDPIILHGDLHHWNILSAKREPWLAIDPKGVNGEPEYEIGAWLRNPFPHILNDANLKDLLTRRVDQLADVLDFDKYRSIGWAYTQSVLAGVWSYEESSNDWRRWFAIAEYFSHLI